MSRQQEWQKLGLIFCPSEQRSWMKSHAAVPIAECLGNDLFRIFFTTRDERNRSNTGYLVVDINRPSDILELSSEPVLVPGDLGEFDDSGAMGSWLVSDEQTRYFYYMGWNLGVTVPFRNSIGLATSTRGDAFQRYARGPVMDRSMQEPHFCSTPCVLKADNLWRMWYLSCTGWRLLNEQPQHRYHIKYAESADGIEWERQGLVAIDYRDDGEYAISRPSVIKDEDGWKMWFSYRGESYRIGYAESEDGRHWKRLDQLAGIDVSPDGWDSEMIEYPYVFDHADRRYMLYNGNGYGLTGFGLAVLTNA